MKLKLVASLAVLGALLLALVGVVGSAGGTATAAPAGTRAPNPHVNPFANRLTGTKSLPNPQSGPVSLPEGYDGCDHGYGALRQCIPWNFPPGTTQRCQWLSVHGLASLVLTNRRDRHHLDTNGDGIACGPGDGP